MEKTTILKDTCLPMFTEALITIAKTWKQPKCPSAEEWAVEYYSAMKKNEEYHLQRDGPT